MTPQEAFIYRQWNAHRATMTHTPKTARLSCLYNGYAAHGGDWDRYEWRGDTQRTEKAYCLCCGKRVIGEPSPWAEAAIQDWYATPYMQRTFLKQRNQIAARRVKRELLGRRRVVQGTTYSRTW